MSDYLLMYHFSRRDFENKPLYGTEEDSVRSFRENLTLGEEIRLEAINNSVENVRDIYKFRVCALEHKTNVGPQIAHLIFVRSRKGIGIVCGDAIRYAFVKNPSKSLTFMERMSFFGI